MHDHIFYGGTLVNKKEGRGGGNKEQKHKETERNRWDERQRDKQEYSQIITVIPRLIFALHRFNYFVLSVVLGVL